MIKEDLNTSLAQTNNLKCLHTLDRLQSQTQISLELGSSTKRINI